MLFSLGIAVVQGFGATYLLSRYLGPIAFGELGVIINSTNLILFANSSVAPQVLKASAQRKDQSISLVTAGISIQLLLSILITLVSFGVLFLSSGDWSLVGPAAVLAASLTMRSLTNSLVAAQMGREKMEWQLIESAQLLLSFLLLFGLIKLGSGLYAFPSSSLVGVLVISGITLWMFGRRYVGNRFLPTAEEVKILFIASLALGVVNLAQQAHWSVEALLAPRLMGPVDVGVFIAGTRFVPITRSLAVAVNLVSLPIFVRGISEANWHKLSREAEQSLRYLTLAGFGGALGLFAFSDWITAVLYPQGFENAAQIIRIVSLNVLPLLLHWEALTLLFAAEKYRALVAGYGLALAIRLALGSWLGIQGGGTGLAVAQVVSDWALALCLHGIALKTLDLHYGKTLLKIVVCMVAALPALAMTAVGISAFTASAVALAVFGLGLFASRVVTLKDIRPLFHLLNSLGRKEEAS